MPPPAQPQRAYPAEGQPAQGEAGEIYRQWLHLRLGHAVVDDLMAPDQAIAWHELCRELRLGAAPLPDDVEEAALAEGMSLEAWLKEPGPSDMSPLWLVGGARAGLCTLVQELLLGLCGPRGDGVRERTGDALPVPLVLCGRTVRGPLGMLGMDVRWDSHEDFAAALRRWWALVERDVRRGLQRGFFAAGLRAEPRALVVIGGIDELPGPSRAAAARWVHELCAAGAPLLVTTRTTDVPELAAEVQRGRLRRAFVQPLARPAIDRFIHRWARIPGEFERAGAPQLCAALDGAPSRLALARRPATLAMQAILVARDGDAADSLAELSRRLVACLDRGKRAHRVLMARVIADRDSPLPAAERATWLAELVAVGAFHDHPELGEALGRDPALAEFGGDLLLRAAQAWAEGSCPIEQVQKGLPEQSAVHHARDRHHDEEIARLAALGRRAGWWGQEHAFALRRGLPPRERLFDVRATEIRPRPLFTALAELQEVWGAYALPLLRAAPLGYVLSEGGAACPVASAALFHPAPPPEVKPVRELFHRAVLLELALVSLAADDDELQAEALDIVLARELDLDAALDRAMLEMLGEARPAGPPIPEGLSERIAYIDGALELASRLTPCGAPGLVADLDRARRLVSAGERGPRLRRLAAFVVVLLLYCIGRRLVPGRMALQRGEVEALMTSLGSPDTVAAQFADDRRAQIAADWEWVTRQRWAPHRVAETVLLHMQESVSLAPEQVLSRCHKWLRAFLGARG
jgi:hypothetical protein